MNIYDQRFTARGHSATINAFSSSPVTILIPRSLYNRARWLFVLDPGAVCLKRLVGRHGVALIELARTTQVRGRITYQASGQDLIRLQFRVSEREWTWLTTLAQGAGMSRCAAFTWMLARELEPGVRVHTPRHQLIPYRSCTVALTVLPDPSRLIRTVSMREFVPDFGSRLLLAARAGPNP